MNENNSLKTPYELFGIECGEGWKPLYQPILDYIKEYNKDKGEDEKIEVFQIKEKFGRLTIYVSSYPKELESMIIDAEKESEHICENCGKHIDKQIVKHHWIYSICEDCLRKDEEKREQWLKQYENKLRK